MIRVLVAEDVRILRDALVALLALEDDIEVVASLASGDVVVAQATEHRPDVAVLDIDLPGTDGLTAAAELRERVPECRVLILTGLGQPGTLRRALSAQVSGFLLKDAQPEELVAAIRRVAAGARVIDPQLALDTLDAPANPLTEREIEVLRCAAAGAEPREIADQLFLSYGTVRNYLASAVTKLGARNRIDAIRIASAAGWMLSSEAGAAEPSGGRPLILRRQCLHARFCAPRWPTWRNSRPAADTSRPDTGRGQPWQR